MTEINGVYEEGSKRSLPEEDGVYIDCDGDLWVRNGEWFAVTVEGDTDGGGFRPPEEFLPFRKCKYLEYR